MLCFSSTEKATLVSHQDTESANGLLLQKLPMVGLFSRAFFGYPGHYCIGHLFIFPLAFFKIVELAILEIANIQTDKL